MNKYKLLIITCVFVSIVSLSKVYAFINGYTLLGKVIYIDPGHGGIDGGTSYKNIQEKDLNLKLSQMLEKENITLREVFNILSDNLKNNKDATNHIKKLEILSIIPINNIFINKVKKIIKNIKIIIN